MDYTRILATLRQASACTSSGCVRPSTALSTSPTGYCPMPYCIASWMAAGLPTRREYFPR